MSKKGDMEIQADFHGLNTLRKALREFDPELSKQMNKTVKAPVSKVYNAARRNVTVAAQDVPSGWKKPGNGKKGWGDPTRLMWDNAKVRSGIKLKQGGRSYGGVRPLYRILNTSPAGNIYEFARVARSSQGVSFTRQLRKEPTSRLIWNAWDAAGGEGAIVPAINEAIQDVYAEFENRLKSVPKGDRVGIR